MSVQYGSSWIFEFIKVFHIRFVRATPHNALIFGTRPKKSLSLHSDIAPLLSRAILDPNDFVNYRLRGHCVPAAIILSILVQHEKISSSRIRKNHVTLGLQSLRYHQFLEGTLTPGIALENFRNLESANSPLPLPLIEAFSSLKPFKGIAINVFRALVRRQEKKDNSNVYNEGSSTEYPTPSSHSPEKARIYLFPTLLSKHNQDTSYAQIDLLIDSPELREKYQSSSNPKSLPHVLCITSLVTLLATNKHGSAFRYNSVCRSCCMVFSNIEDLNHHQTACNTFPTGGKCQKRKAKNKKVTQHFRVNPYTGHKERNGLFFQRGHLYRTLKPLTLSSLDLETISEPIDPRSEAPKPSGAESIHTVFAYSIAHISLYPENHPLPESLRSPRGLIYDPKTQSETAFGISLLKNLRDDLKLHSQFLREAIEKDQGAPKFSTMSRAEKLAFALQSTCFFCGRTFGRMYTNPHTHKRTRLVKCKDHLHFLETSQLAR